MIDQKARNIILICFIAILVASISLFFLLRKRAPQSPVTPVQEESLIALDDLSIDSLTKVLDLSSAQVKRLQPILKTEKRRHDAIMRTYVSDSGQLTEAGMKQLADFRSYYENMYSHILNEEQFARYLRVRKESNQH